MEKYIYHICQPEYFEAFDGKDFYYSASLERDGFIHCSFEHQIKFVLDSFFKEHDGLSLLKIDTDLLDSKLVIEGPIDDLGAFPHIYGQINMSSIIETSYIK